MSSRSLAFLVAAAAMALACHGANVPQSVQRGSTFLIPLGGSFAVAGARIGYGGTEYTDHQRGAMVYRLGGATGPKFVTRATTTLFAHPASFHARVGQAYVGAVSGFQHFSLVDVPDDPVLFPDGVHTIHVSREDAEGETPLGMLAETLEILPGTGEPTPFEGWCGLGGCGPFDASQDVAFLTPDPQILITLGVAVHAAEIEVHYPAAAIDVVDAVHVPSALPQGAMLLREGAITWVATDGTQSGTGTATISAAATGTAFQTVGAVFTLDDGPSQILDLANVTVTLLGAYDETGTPVATTATATDIR